MVQGVHDGPTGNRGSMVIEGVLQGILPTDAQLLTLREEHTLRVCETRVLGKLFGPKTDEQEN
jgi:hypothetical protein